MRQSIYQRSSKIAKKLNQSIKYQLLLRLKTMTNSAADRYNKIEKDCSEIDLF